jgi:predicted transcriptional regulator
LPFEYRALLALRELDERPCEQIADILDLSPPAVESFLFRARRALREELESVLRCRRAERAISRCLDGELGDRERSALRRHLYECAACRDFDQIQRAHRAALRRLGNVPLPTSLSPASGRAERRFGAE